MPNFSFNDSVLQINIFQEDKLLLLECLDKKSGKSWPKTPLCNLEIYAKAEFRCETVAEYQIYAVESVSDGLHVIIGDQFRKIRIGLWLQLDKGELKISMPMVECYEDKKETFRLFCVNLLPDLMKAADDGCLLLPLNTGMLCFPKNKPERMDSFMIYGEQPRWELMPMLPIGAVQTPQGGLMALITSVPAETCCNVSTDGKGSGKIGFGFTLRQLWIDPVEFATREIRFIPVPPKADIVHFTAKRLRRHIMEDLGKPTLQKRLAESPQFAQLLDSYIMKLFFAVENNGIMMHDAQKGDPISFKKVMTFDEAARGLKLIKEAGIDKVHTQNVGWNPGGHDGLWPTRFPIEDRLGGESRFRALIAAGIDLGFTMNVHDNWLSVYKRSPDYREERLIHDMWGKPMGLGEWGGGITYINNTLTFTDKEIAAEFRRVKAIGLTGAGYLDGMGNPCYRDYHPSHPMTRSDYARATARLVSIASSVYGSAATECGFLYATLPADCITTPGNEWHLKHCWPQWPITDLSEKRVPVWQLALHGLVILESHDLSWESVMECVLMGDHPRDEWSAHKGIMPVLDDERIRKIKAKYDICLKRFGRLQLLEMMTYAEPQAGVKITKFEDGTEVVADFNKKELVVNGEEIKRPDALVAD